MSEQADKKDCPECGGEETLIRRSLKMNGTLIYVCDTCGNTEEYPA